MFKINVLIILNNIATGYIIILLQLLSSKTNVLNQNVHMILNIITTWNKIMLLPLVNRIKLLCKISVLYFIKYHCNSIHITTAVSQQRIKILFKIRGLIIINTIATAYIIKIVSTKLYNLYISIYDAKPFKSNIQQNSFYSINSKLYLWLYSHFVQRHHSLQMRK